MNFELSHSMKSPNVFSVIHSPKSYKKIKKKMKKINKIQKKNITIITKSVQSEDNVLSGYDIIDTVKS